MKWLEDLKVGDKVLVCRANHEGVATVTRVSAASVWVVGGRAWVGQSEERYNRKTGRAAGSDVWSCDRIEKATPERIERIKLRRGRDGIVEMIKKRAATLTLDQLERIAAIVEEKHDAN